MPTRGQIRKIIRSTGLAADNQHERPTNTFSYKELRSGVVYFIPFESVEATQQDVDRFDYQLHIKTVQPAQASVKIVYRQAVEDTGTVTKAATDFSLNYVAIICALIILLMCILIIMLILKFRYLKRHKANISKDQPPSLPCPPDLTSVSPQHHLSHHHHPHHYASSEADSVPVTGNSTPLPGFSNIPHCKIIPVESYKHD